MPASPCRLGTTPGPWKTCVQPERVYRAVAFRASVVVNDAAHMANPHSSQQLSCAPIWALVCGGLGLVCFWLCLGALVASCRLVLFCLGREHTGPIRFLLEGRLGPPQGGPFPGSSWWVTPDYAAGLRDSGKLACGAQCGCFVLVDPTLSMTCSQVLSCGGFLFSLGSARSGGP